MGINKLKVVLTEEAQAFLDAQPFKAQQKIYYNIFKVEEGLMKIDIFKKQTNSSLNAMARGMTFGVCSMVSSVLRLDWYHLDLLYVDERYRRHHVGTDLINCIKKISLQYELTGIKLETWDFQARDFYVKNGFTIFGELRDCPPGTIVFYLKYTFKNEEKMAQRIFSVAARNAV